MVLQYHLAYDAWIQLFEGHLALELQNQGYSDVTRPQDYE